MHIADILSSNRKNLVADFQRIQGMSLVFAAWLTAYQQIEGKIKATKEFTPAELEQWDRTLMLLLDLSREAAIDAETAKYLCAHTLACVRRTPAEASSARKLTVKLCEICKVHHAEETLVGIIRTDTAGLCPKHIQCLIWAEVSPGSQEALSFFRSLAVTPAGAQMVAECAASGIERIVAWALAEKGYATYGKLLDWVARAFPPAHHCRKAAQLVTGLWQGRIRVLSENSLDADYDEYFGREQSTFFDHMRFSIACMTGKMEFLQTFLNRVPEYSIPWASGYEKIIKAFIRSFNGQYPDIGKQSVNQPHEGAFAGPLQTFVLLAFIQYATKHIMAFNPQRLYGGLTGPWALWVGQFGHRDVPYQRNPDRKKFEQLLWAEGVAADIKNQVAPWAVEFIYYLEGNPAAQRKIQQLHGQMRQAAENRLRALEGTLTEERALVMDSLNDILCLLRLGIARRDASMVRTAMEHASAVKLHENERVLCDIAIKCIEASPLSPNDIAAARKIGECGLPIALLLVGRRFFAMRNFQEAAPLLERCCICAPAVVPSKELFAQALVYLGRADEAIGILENAEPALSAKGKELLGWCLFYAVFPTDVSLVAAAFVPGGIPDNQSARLKKAAQCLANSAGGLGGFIGNILESLCGRASAPETCGEFEPAREWLTVRRALAASDIDQFRTTIEAIKTWQKPYASDSVKALAEAFLGRLDIDDEANADAVQYLLNILEKRREDYYQTRLIADILAGKDLDEIRRRYQSIYTNTHPVFALVELYHAVGHDAFDKALSIIEAGAVSAQGDTLDLCAIYCLARMEKWDELYNRICDKVASVKSSALKANLLQWSLQIALVRKKADERNLFRMAAENGIGLDGLPPVFKSYLMKAALSVAASTKDPETMALLKKSVDPGFRQFLDIIACPFEEFVSIIAGFKATGNWGNFLYHKAIYCLLEETRKASESLAVALLAKTIPAVIQFVSVNNLAGIPEEETKALQRILEAVEGTDQTRRSLAGVLQVDDPQEIVPLSNLLLKALEFPKTIADFEQSAAKFMANADAPFLDRIWLFCGVIDCWIQYLEEQKILKLDVLSVLLKFWSAGRTASLVHPEFKQWVLEKRKTLPADEQYCKETEDFLQYPVYEWFVQHFTRPMDNFFAQNKGKAAQCYAKALLSITEDPVRVIAPIGVQGIDWNGEQISLIKDVCTQAVDKWIKDKKGNLESQMPASEAQKVHYKFDYEKGLKIVHRILEVFPNNKDLLKLGLHYANCWNEDHYACASNDLEEIYNGSAIQKKILNVIRDFSNFFADELIPQCTSGAANEHLLENQEIAKHFYFKALVENQAKPYVLIDGVLRWDSSHDRILWFYRNKFIAEANNGKLTVSEAKGRLKELLKRCRQGTPVYQDVSQQIQ